MLTILKNTTKLEIKNVICFYVGLNTHISTAAELKNKKEEDWSYQDYLVASCDKHEYNLIWFNKATVNYSFVDGVLNINDEVTDSHISLSHKNIHDTIIFQGQANDDMDINYEGLMRALEYMKFFMLNTVDEIKLASDKYLSANLLSAHNIPQPNYVLITRDLMEDMSTDCKDTRETFWKLIDQVYANNPNATEATGDIKYVCKILGGSLGIGVFICTRAEIEGILQAMFQLDGSAKFIIQEFKKNTGDIRVHLLSVDGINYEVLACMKRNKIAKDFRSNVSLGATTDKYKLNEEQEKIVMKTAAASGCRWVGVDLMECEDGSNVVIEYNSSPGVQGISQQIKNNMFDIVFDKINDYIKKHTGYSKDKQQEENKRNNCFSNYDSDVVDNLTMIWQDLSENRQNLLNECLNIQPGTRYELHGKDLENDCGLDCSGYCKYVAKKALNVNLPSMCAKYFQTFKDNEFEMISEEELQPGDIGIKNESTILNHCGFYAGDGKWFESSLMYGIQLTDYDKFKHYFRIKGID